jgi:hypothetical protein
LRFDSLDWESGENLLAWFSTRGAGTTLSFVAATFTSASVQ